MEWRNWRGTSVRSHHPPDHTIFLFKRSIKTNLFFSHFNWNILYVDGWRTSFGSIVQKFVVNYLSVVSYPQQYHIGIDANYLCVIIFSIHIMLYFACTCASLWKVVISCSHNCKCNKKQTNLPISNMLKRHNAFNGNLTIFLPNATKTQIVPKVEFVRFWMIVFYRLYVCNIYNITA